MKNLRGLIHTPGPWTIDTPMGELLPWITPAETADGTEVSPCLALCTLEDNEIPRQEAMANLHLMALVPEFLHALSDAEDALSWYDQNPNPELKRALATVRDVLKRAGVDLSMRE